MTSKKSIFKVGSSESINKILEKQNACKKNCILENCSVFMNKIFKIQL